MQPRDVLPACVASTHSRRSRRDRAARCRRCARQAGNGRARPWHQRAGVEADRTARQQVAPAQGDEVGRAGAGADEMDGHAPRPGARSRKSRRPPRCAAPSSRRVRSRATSAAASATWRPKRVRAASEAGEQRARPAPQRLRAAGRSAAGRAARPPRAGPARRALAVEREQARTPSALAKSAQRATHERDDRLALPPRGSRCRRDELMASSAAIARPASPGASRKRPTGSACAIATARARRHTARNSRAARLRLDRHRVDHQPPARRKRVQRRSISAAPSRRRRRTPRRAAAGSADVRGLAFDDFEMRDAEARRRCGRCARRDPGALDRDGAVGGIGQHPFDRDRAGAGADVPQQLAAARRQRRERDRADLALGDLAVMLEPFVGQPGARRQDARTGAATTSSATC